MSGSIVDQFVALLAIVAGVSGSIGNRGSADILVESAMAAKARILECSVKLAADMTPYTVGVLCSSTPLQSFNHRGRALAANANWDCSWNSLGNKGQWRRECDQRPTIHTHLYFARF